MQPIFRAWCAHIDVTYHCGKECIYCTRNIRHLGNRKYHMNLADFSIALSSYKNWPKSVGIMGGEPLLHPLFKEICAIMREHNHKYILWTSIDPKKTKYAEAVEKTFAKVAYHPHTEEQREKYTHQMSTIAIKDAVKDEVLRNSLIDDCWLQRKWCPVITDDGAFFCEVGASIAKLMGIKGWKVESGWWKRRPKHFGYQKEFCQYCGIPIPMKGQTLENQREKISPSLLELLEEQGLPLGNYEVFDREITVQEMVDALPNWHPGVYKVELERDRERYCWSTLDWSKWK